MGTKAEPIPKARKASDRGYLKKKGSGDLKVTRQRIAPAARSPNCFKVMSPIRRKR